MTALTVFRNYLEVLKPRETLLLGFIGLCSAIIAADGNLSPGTLVLATVTITIASGGANGLTNYLDREIDARMSRTKKRVFPTKRIHPPQKAIPWIIGWIIAGLILAWVLHPWAFVADLIGTVAAGVYRKRAICVFPQGAIASCAPVVMGWFAVTDTASWELGLLCLLIVVWLPLHVWSVMVSHRDDYLQAGLKFFPMNVSVGLVTSILLVFALVLNIVALSFGFVARLGILYNLFALGLGLLMLYSSARLLATSASSQAAWRLYKLSSFPYLGLIFFAAALSVLL